MVAKEINGCCGRTLVAISGRSSGGTPGACPPFHCVKPSSDRSNPYIFGITGNLFENARAWC